MGYYRVFFIVAILGFSLSIGPVVTAQQSDRPRPGKQVRQTAQTNEPATANQPGETAQPDQATQPAESEQPSSPNQAAPAPPQPPSPAPQAPPPAPHPPQPAPVPQVLPRAPQPPPTPQQKPPSRATFSIENNEISINFENAPILEVIDVMSRVTGKNFIVDPAVKGTVTVIAPKRIPKDEAYGVFESILELNGFSLVPMGNVIKVVPNRTATQKSIPVQSGREVSKVHEGDQIITQLIPIKYSDAQSIVGAITPLISRDANVTAYTNTNTVILTDTSANIKRLLSIIQEIDIPGFEPTITILPLQNASADTLAQEILQALESGGGAAPGMPGASRTQRRPTPQPSQPTAAGAPTTPIKIIPDARTNSLIVVANELDTEQVKFLVHELDKATPIEANNIHVYRLENALAEDVAKVLMNLASTTAPAGGAPGGAAAAAAAAAAAGGPAGGVRTFYKEVSIVADKTTNSLIITATPQDYAVISSVIDQLDIMRPQVLVETLIAEVSVDLQRDLGIKWQAGIPHEDDAAGFAGFNSTNPVLPSGTTDITDILPTFPLTTGSGLSVGYVDLGTVFGNEFIRGLVNLNANQSNTDFNVLSAPHVLTLDNQKATINVSDNVPFITQQVSEALATTTVTGSTTTNVTFEYRDVGIILEITPHISPERVVRLEIVQKVNDVSQVNTSGLENVLTEKKREATTTVMVKDRHTLVLGGLMKDSDNVTINKVPFLGDIPILGWAFKTKSNTRTKTNLLIFITPSIVANVAEASEVTIQKKNESGPDLQKRMEGSPSLQKSETFGAKPKLDQSSLHEAGPK